MKMKSIMHGSHQVVYTAAAAPVAYVDLSVGLYFLGLISSDLVLKCF